MNRLRILLVCLAGLMSLVVLASCGEDTSDGSGDGGGESSPLDSEGSAEEILDQTFSTDAEIRSADLDLTFDFKVVGEGASNFSANLSGPIDSAGDGIPSFDLTATIKGTSESDSIDLDVGATSTGEAAYVSYNGTDYELDGQTFGFLEEAFKASESSSESSSVPSGLPQIREFLTDVTNEGTEDVEGTETVHISGAVDVDKLVETIRPFADQAGALGAGGQVPTPAELDQLSELVRDATFDVYSGADDSLLRRLQIEVSLDQIEGEGTAELLLDFTLGSVNESQTIDPPDQAKPLSALLDELDLGLLGGLGSGGLGGAGGETPSPGPATDDSPGPNTGQVPSPGAAEEYLACIDGVQTQEQLLACQELLN